MIKQVKFNKSIKIGFFNQVEKETNLSENLAQLLESFKREFDVVIMNDGNFALINQIIKEVYSTQLVSKI